MLGYGDFLAVVVGGGQCGDRRRWWCGGLLSGDFIKFEDFLLTVVIFDFRRLETVAGDGGCR